MTKTGNSTWYYSFDGDQVGRRIQTMILENDTSGVREFSRVVTACVTNLRDRLVGLGCEVLFAAGDSVMVIGPPNLPIEVLPVRVNGLTFSVGIGTTPREALIALARAKTEGRGQTVLYKEA